MSSDTTNSSLKQFVVTVHDNRYIRHVVYAADEDDARLRVEVSPDAVVEFGGTTIESHWCIESVEEA